MSDPWIVGTLGGAWCGWLVWSSARRWPHVREAWRQGTELKHRNAELRAELDKVRASHDWLTEQAFGPSVDWTPPPGRCYEDFDYYSDLGWVALDDDEPASETETLLLDEIRRLRVRVAQFEHPSNPGR